MQTHMSREDICICILIPHKKNVKAIVLCGVIRLSRRDTLFTHYNNLNSKMHFISVMSAVRSLLLCCEQISVWLSRFRGQNPAICHIWQPSRFSPEGTINPILNLTEVFSLCTVHTCFIKERLDLQCPGKHPLASYLMAMHPNVQRPFYLVSALNFPYKQ